MRTTGIGASRPLPSVLTKVRLLNRLPTLDLGNANYSSCPKAGAPRPLPERLAVTDDHEPTFTAFPPDRSSRSTAVVRVAQRPGKLPLSRKRSKKTQENGLTRIVSAFLQV